MSATAAAQDTDLPLMRKLRGFIGASTSDTRALLMICAPRHCAAADTPLVNQGTASRSALLMHSGWAIRHRCLADGRRQIMEFLLPGDFCDPSSFVTCTADSTIVAITPIEYSLVAPETLLEAISHSPRLGVCLWWLESQHASMMRSHLSAVGRMRARERIAYLIWELTRRLDLVLPAPPAAYTLPISQEMIADATGLSVVHVSRTLARLQRDGVIHRHGHTYQILCSAKLRALAQIDSDWPQGMPAEVLAGMNG
ncbi:MAG: Crp/Fnr family transcriptional regulator [Gammaproteobacteria bacterium]|nr:Crp/Fnr family transcriptional regulator [Gammaproteobacteria bacterium]